MSILSPEEVLTASYFSCNLFAENWVNNFDIHFPIVNNTEFFSGEILKVY